MANTCYFAVELDNLNDFNNALAYASNNSFDGNTDFAGAAVWADRYILRFESKWKPELAVGSRISRECRAHLKLWYQETGCGLAGWVEYDKYGKKIHTHKIPLDITRSDMQECLYITDWSGIDWWQTFGERGEYCIKIKGEPGNPYFFRVRCTVHNDKLQEVILRTRYGCDYDLKDIIAEFEKNPEKSWAV